MEKWNRMRLVLLILLAVLLCACAAIPMTGLESIVPIGL